MGALNLPSAADIERLTRRVRSVSQRLEGIEDGVDRLDRALSQQAGGGTAGATSVGVDVRLTAIEEQLATLNRQLGELRDAIPGAGSPVSVAQERLSVDAPPSAEEPNGGRTTPDSRRSARASNA